MNISYVVLRPHWSCCICIFYQRPPSSNETPGMTSYIMMMIYLSVKVSSSQDYEMNIIRVRLF